MRKGRAFSIVVAVFAAACGRSEAGPAEPPSPHVVDVDASCPTCGIVVDGDAGKPCEIDEDCPTGSLCDEVTSFLDERKYRICSAGACRSDGDCDAGDRCHARFLESTGLCVPYDTCDGGLHGADANDAGDFTDVFCQATGDTCPSPSVSGAVCCPVRGRWYERDAMCLADEAFLGCMLAAADADGGDPCDQTPVPRCYCTDERRVALIDHGPAYASFDFDHDSPCDDSIASSHGCDFDAGATSTDGGSDGAGGASGSGGSGG